MGCWQREVTVYDHQFNTFSGDNSSTFDSKKKRNILRESAQKVLFFLKSYAQCWSICLSNTLDDVRECQSKENIVNHVSQTSTFTCSFSIQSNCPCKHQYVFTGLILIVLVQRLFNLNLFIFYTCLWFVQIRYNCYQRWNAII